VSQVNWCRQGESNDTRLLILRNLLQTYERKNRTTRCMPASYVQNHVQRNRALRRCSSSQVLTKITVLACLLLRRFYPLCPPGPCSIQWKARATTYDLPLPPPHGPAALDSRTYERCRKCGLVFCGCLTLE